MKNTPTEQSTSITGKGLLQTVCVCVLLTLILYLINPVFMNKTARYNVLSGHVRKDRQYDVIFAGSSHMNAALYPMRLWEIYGYTSFNNAQTAEIIPVSYYTCKEAIEKHSPKVLVLDVYTLYHGKKDSGTKWMHLSIDRLSVRNRFAAVFDLVPMKNLEEFLFPLALYHSRWKELSKADFVPSLDVRRGCGQVFTLAEDLKGLPFEYELPNVKRHPPIVAVQYLDRITELCKETGTQLVLVALPYFISNKVKGTNHNLKNDQSYFNWTADYAKRKGIPYINYFHLVDKIGFDWVQCLHDFSHTNYWRGCIITDHLGKYLSEHYKLPDRRGNKNYAHWDNDLKIYNSQLEKHLAASHAKR